MLGILFQCTHSCKLFTVSQRDSRQRNVNDAWSGKFVIYSRNIFFYPHVSLISMSLCLVSFPSVQIYCFPSYHHMRVLVRVRLRFNICLICYVYFWLPIFLVMFSISVSISFLFYALPANLFSSTKKLLSFTVTFFHYEQYCQLIPGAIVKVIHGLGTTSHRVDKRSLKAVI